MPAALGLIVGLAVLIVGLFAVNAYRVGSQPVRSKEALLKFYRGAAFSCAIRIGDSQPRRTTLDLADSELLHSSCPSNQCPQTLRTSLSPTC